MRSDPADGFDETLGYRFSTYAVPAILGEIKRLFRDGGAVKVSRSLKEKSREAVRLRDEISVSLGREPTVSELSEKLGINEFETVELLNIAVPPASLTATDEEGERQIDIPVDFGEEQIQNSIALLEIIGKMPESDRRLIELLYYKGLTQTVTAEKLGLSQVQVSRRERLLLQEMRRKMTG